MRHCAVHSAIGLRHCAPPHAPHGLTCRSRVLLCIMRRSRYNESGSEGLFFSEDSLTGLPSAQNHHESDQTFSETYGHHSGHDQHWQQACQQRNNWLLPGAAGGHVQAVQHNVKHIGNVYHNGPHNHSNLTTVHQMSMQVNDFSHQQAQQSLQDCWSRNRA